MIDEMRDVDETDLALHLAHRPCLSINGNCPSLLRQQPAAAQVAGLGACNRGLSIALRQQVLIHGTAVVYGGRIAAGAWQQCARCGDFQSRVCVMEHRMAKNVAKAVALFATAVSPFVSHADELTGPIASQAFVFGGVDATKNSVFTWSGITAIPFAKIAEDGFRLRAMGGYGQYRYRTSAVADGENTGTITSGELLAGNRTSFGTTVLTGYVGLDAKNYRLQDADPKNPESGSRIGIKAALELFTRTAPVWFVTAYGNISSVFGNYSLRGAVNHEFNPGFALGAEAGLLGDERYDEQRFGLIATMTFTKGSVTAAAGLAHSSDNGSGAYTTLTLYAPF
jgi:hypothetical protein